MAMMAPSIFKMYSAYEYVFVVQYRISIVITYFFDMSPFILKVYFYSGSRVL